MAPIILFALYLLLALGTWWPPVFTALYRWKTGQPLGNWRTAPLVLSVAVFIVATVHLGPDFAILLAIFPPVILLLLGVGAAPIFTAGLALAAMPVAALVWRVCISIAPLRAFALGLSSIAFLLAATWSGELVSRLFMFVRATELGQQQYARRPFHRTVLDSAMKEYRQAHGSLTLDGRVHIWSYSQLDWVPFTSRSKRQPARPGP